MTCIVPPKATTSPWLTQKLSQEETERRSKICLQKIMDQLRKIGFNSERIKGLLRSSIERKVRDYKHLGNPSFLSPSNLVFNQLKDAIHFDADDEALLEKGEMTKLLYHVQEVGGIYFDPDAHVDTFENSGMALTASQANVKALEVLNSSGVFIHKSLEGMASEVLWLTAHAERELLHESYMDKRALEG